MYCKFEKIDDSYVSLSKLMKSVLWSRKSAIVKQIQIEKAAIP